MTLTAFTAILALITQIGTGSQDWVLQYDGKSTNEIRWDKRIESLINIRVPARLSTALLDALSGPPEPVLITEHRYASMSACVPHACLTKGFFWIDTRTGVGLGAVFGAPADRLHLGSNGIAPTQIPAAAREALIDWLTENDLTPSQVEFSNSRATTSPLDSLGFQPKARFKPPAGGPSFDCAHASGEVEHAICSDSDLSSLDLSLFTLADTIRRGHATTTARNQLLDLQRAWVQHRDLDCGTAADIKACLQAKYREQSDILMHWLPKG